MRADWQCQKELPPYAVTASAGSVSMENTASVTLGNVRETNLSQIGSRAIFPFAGQVLGLGVPFP